jgi:hypothetical protein
MRPSFLVGASSSIAAARNVSRGFVFAETARALHMRNRPLPGGDVRVRVAEHVAESFGERSGLGPVLPARDGAYAPVGVPAGSLGGVPRRSSWA